MILEKTIKIEFRPNKKQRMIIHKTLGVCRFLWNEFLFRNAEYWNENKKFFSGYEFDKYVNNVLSIEKPWIKEVSNKARKDTIMKAHKALWRHFESKGSSHEVGFPKIKRKHDQVNSYFFIKDGIRLDPDNSSYLWIPILRFIKLKEKNYLTSTMILYVTSGRIVKEKEKYYVCLILQGYPYVNFPISNEKSDGIGIDLGTSTLCTIYQNGKSTKIYNPIYGRKYKESERKIRRLQQVISHKEEINMKKYGYEERKSVKRGDATKIYHTHNIQRLRKRINKLKSKQSNIIYDYLKKTCANLARTNPEFITIEDLDVSRMLEHSSHALSDHIQKSNFYYFRMFLIHKCKEYGLELRLANRWYASSKTCSKCGHKKKKLKLDERTYICKKCGLEIDRDENAAINLYYTKDYILVA